MKNWTRFRMYGTRYLSDPRSVMAKSNCSLNLDVWFSPFGLVDLD